MFLVIGLSAGWVAQAVITPRQPHDWGRALVTGLLGSFAGGLLASLLAGDGLKIRPSGLIGSILGALAVASIAELVARPAPHARG